MNPVFSLIARLKGNTEEKETGTSEIIFKNSGLVVPTRQKSNKGINRQQKTKSDINLHKPEFVVPTGIEPVSKV